MSFYIKDKQGKYFVGLLIDCERTIFEFRDNKYDAYKFCTFSRAFVFVRFISSVRNCVIYDFEIVKGE